VTEPQPTGQTIPGLTLPVPSRGQRQGPFGAANRARLLTRYLEEQTGEVTPANTWEHIYRLLLWIDRTIGLAHCYESDKCQPGRPWYARSLAFHHWLAGALGTSPSSLADEIDVLFQWATEDLAAQAAARSTALPPDVKRQREPYAGQGLPEPGQDPELEAIITEVLEPYLHQPPSAEDLHRLTERINAYLRLENKRKNLLGEGFEDTLAALMRQIPSIGGAYNIHVRPWLHDLPGFYQPRARDKPPEVDVALVRRADGYRTLVTCKWSVRSDRERQFASDFADYSRQESANQSWDYVLVTNEFDPARLARACDNRRENALIFNAVVHVNLAGPSAAYSAPVRVSGERGGVANARAHAETGRLVSLEAWLARLAEPPR
jgi:hypothetical protein